MCLSILKFVLYGLLPAALYIPPPRVKSPFFEKVQLVNVGLPE